MAGVGQLQPMAGTRHDGGDAPKPAIGAPPARSKNWYYRRRIEGVRNAVTAGTG
jgi:hypothetical protein